MDGVWGRGARVIQTPKSLTGAGGKAAEAPGLGAPPRGSADGDGGLTTPRVSCGRDTRGFVAFRLDSAAFVAARLPGRTTERSSPPPERRD